MPDPHTPAPLTVAVDDRERRPGLADAIAALGRRVAVTRLPVGDVEIGPRVLVERKTVADFVLSVEEGRLFEQAFALRGACWRPLLIVEGEEPYDAARLSSRTLRGILASLLVGYGLPILRTASIAETAEWIETIAVREERRLARGARRATKPDARIAMDVLGAIPGVGDGRARRLVERFGTVGAALAAGEAELMEVPGIGRQTAREIRSVATGSRGAAEATR